MATSAKTRNLFFTEKVMTRLIIAASRIVKTGGACHFSFCVIWSRYFFGGRAGWASAGYDLRAGAHTAFRIDQKISGGHNSVPVRESPCYGDAITEDGAGFN